jgi:hypothetical protein
VEYVVRVIAVNKLYSSDAKSATINIIAAVCPGAPQLVSNVPSITSSSQIGLSWQQEKDGGAPIVEWKVFKQQVGGQWVIAASNLKATETTISQLTMGNYYQFYVVARNKKCESGPSQSV